MTNRSHRFDSIKYWILSQFYGIEEYLDMDIAVPTMVDSLDSADSDYSMVLRLKELDLWCIQVTGINDSQAWSPFEEPLYQFAARNDFLTAHMRAEKQWCDKDIIRHSGCAAVLC